MLSRARRKMMVSERRLRRTKIVATLGPGSAAEDTIRSMIAAGVNVFRINSSHGTTESRADMMQLVRRVGSELDVHVGLLVDLQGPRIRVGQLDEPVELEPGSDIVFAPESSASGAEIPTTYEYLAADVTVGNRILLDDGLLVTQVSGIADERVTATVIHGGWLGSNKGINLPGVQVSAPAVTEKDVADIKVAIENHADYLGVSFVRRGKDVEAVREKVPSWMRLVAKIEKLAALEHLQEIIETADVVMVARGDLGVELPFEKVPLAQKRVIAEAMRLGKPVITATQMLESMMRSLRPTRAEASDVANAILDGTDAVMLSAETAIGEYPVEAVNAMARIITEIERFALDLPSLKRRRPDWSAAGDVDVETAIAGATCAAAEMLAVPLIVCFTKSGFTARKVSSRRPLIPILGLSTELTTCRQLALVWGVIPEWAEQAPNYEAMLDMAKEILVAKNYVSRGDRIVVTAGVPFDVPGTTNLLKVEVV